MPRKPRIQSKIDCYHIMMNGINKEYIFQTKDNKEKFLELLNEQEGLIKIYAWCVMDNHVHFVIKATLAEMSKAIKIISLKYTAYYNKLNDRSGPLFGDRYKSENIDDEIYMQQVIRYIHLNPLKAKIVNKIEEYPCSSYKYFVNNAKINNNKSYIMNLFNANINSYIEFHYQNDEKEYLE